MSDCKSNGSILELHNVIILRYSFYSGWRNLKILPSGECRKIHHCCIFHVNGLEAKLAEEWFSPELMSALRSENLLGELTEKRSEIVRLVKAQVVGSLQSGSFNSRRLADIVNYIKLSPEFFSEWHQSETAMLFVPPVFRNEQKASIYFF